MSCLHSCRLNKCSNTLNGRLGKVVCLACWRLQGRFPADAAMIYTMYGELRGTAHKGGGCVQSIGSTVSDAIVRSLFSISLLHLVWLDKYTLVMMCVRFQTGMVADFAFLDINNYLLRFVLNHYVCSYIISRLCIYIIDNISFSNDVFTFGIPSVKMLVGISGILLNVVCT